MALPSVGGGYQFTDGNTNELEIDTQAAPPKRQRPRQL
jgi:hypothetical protein